MHLLFLRFSFQLLLGEEVARQDKGGGNEQRPSKRPGTLEGRVHAILHHHIHQEGEHRRRETEDEHECGESGCALVLRGEEAAVDGPGLVLCC